MAPQTILERMQAVIDEHQFSNGVKHTLPTGVLIALELGVARIKHLEANWSIGNEVRANLAAQLMPPVNGSTHPDDIIKSANVAVATTDALIEALQK